MEPQGSLPHSQVPATCPYTEPDQSCPSPTPQSHFLTIRLTFELPTIRKTLKMDKRTSEVGAGGGF